MTPKKIVTTSKRRRARAFEGFSFTSDDIPSTSGILGSYRRKAWGTFEQLPYPTTKDEPWRRTDIRGLDGSLALPKDEAYLDLQPMPTRLLNPLVGKEHGGQIALLPGGIITEVSDEITQKGVIFSDLESAAQNYPDIVSEKLGKIVSADEGKFAALTAAIGQNGVFVYIPRGVHLEQPLHSVVWAPGVGLAHFSHLIIWVDDGASLTYVHEAASPDNEGQTFHGGIVEIHVGTGANLRFVELQSFGNNVWNFTHERARVERDGNLDWIFGAIGTRLTKNFSDLDLVGDGSTGRMSGFYFTDGDQHLDHDTQQNHLAPHTTSDLLFKGALKGNSRSVWQGMIYVAPGAQQTDGYQANRNLVLSKNARADSIPGLEILADDVRCTHGATVGKIDPELVFYLRSRGIPKDEAERLVVEGFFDPIMQRIPFEGVRTHFQQAIEAKMA
ncbi:MAG: Fe-S cluster assembly protein SufD [Anaerolineales bacterium]|jgi:Fe-S cluster assembly protein SufD